MDNTLIMGRKTYDSIPKPLFRRNTIVLTKTDIKIKLGDCIYKKCSLSSALALAFNLPGNIIYVVGGEKVYAAMLPIADMIYLTRVTTPNHINGDTFFPNINYDEWSVTSDEKKSILVDGQFTDTKIKIDYIFQILNRVI